MVRLMCSCTVYQASSQLLCWEPGPDVLMRGGGVQLHDLNTFKPTYLFKSIRFFGTDINGLQYSSSHTWEISKVVIPGSHSHRLGINCSRVSAGHQDFKISPGASYVRLRLNRCFQN